MKVGSAECPNGGAQPPHGGHCPRKMAVIAAATPMAAADAKSTCGGSGCACRGRTVCGSDHWKSVMPFLHDMPLNRPYFVNITINMYIMYIHICKYMHYVLYFMDQHFALQ